MTPFFCHYSIHFVYWHCECRVSQNVTYLRKIQDSRMICQYTTPRLCEIEHDLYFPMLHTKILN